MRVWYQSGAPLGKDKRHSAYYETLQNHLQSVARPGTEVSVHGVERSSPYRQISRYEEVLHDYQVAENFLQAQREGYDAFCVGSVLDDAQQAIREVAEIPYANITEVSVLLACLLAPNFALLCHSQRMLLRITEQVKRYGLQGRCIPVDDFGVSKEDLPRGFDDPEFILKPARKLAKEAARKGVCMFVPAEGILHMIIAKHNVTHLEGIPVIEGGGAMIKVMEMLVDLKKMGIEASRLGLWAPLPKEELSNLRKIYGLQ